MRDLFVPYGADVPWLALELMTRRVVQRLHGSRGGEARGGGGGRGEGEAREGEGIIPYFLAQPHF